MSLHSWVEDTSLLPWPQLVSSVPSQGKVVFTAPVAGFTLQAFVLLALLVSVCVVFSYDNEQLFHICKYIYLICLLISLWYFFMKDL